MNQILLIGRLTRNPEIRYTAGGENSIAVARYTLAVDRRYKRQGDEQTADFIKCVAFGKLATFAENYLHQGTKIAVSGRIQTGSYTNKDGQKIFTTDVIIQSQEFVESKSKAKSSTATSGSNFSNNNKFADNATDDAAYQYFN